MSGAAAWWVLANGILPLPHHRGIIGADFDIGQNCISQPSDCILPSGKRVSQEKILSLIRSASRLWKPLLGSPVCALQRPRRV